MSIAANVKEKVNNLEPGTIIKYSDLKNISTNSIALSKAIAKLIKENKLTRIKKGLFYVPKKTKFGYIPPSINEILKKELVKNGKTIGYITGVGLYNKLGLTTQIPNIIEIGTNKRKQPKVINGKKIKYIKAYAKIKNTNIELLQILDAIKNIKKIPDSDINESYEILKEKIKQLNITKKQNLFTLSLEYPPMTRALTGAILEEVSDINLKKLENSLNIFTKFELNIKTIQNKKRWNIK